MNKYDDIINLERPKSYRPKMSISDRASQFAPFAALNGYDDRIIEEARIVDSKVEMDEERLFLLDMKFQLIKDRIKEKPKVSLNYFVKDRKKNGGIYITKIVSIIKLDELKRIITTSDMEIINMDDIYDID